MVVDAEDTNLTYNVCMSIIGLACMKLDGGFWMTNDDVLTLSCEYDSLKHIKSVLKDVIMSKLLSLTKNGKVYSLKAEEYIDYLNSFSSYCIEEMKHDFEENVRKTVYAAGEMDDNFLSTLLYAYNDAGKFMKLMHEGKTIDEIQELVWWPVDSCVLILMLKYSENGIEFTEKMRDILGMNDSELFAFYREKKVPKK